MRPQPKTAGRNSRPDLEEALERVVEEYGAFVAAGPAPGTEGDIKAFAARHAACRAALTHLEQLLKLARVLGTEAATSGDLGRAAQLLEQARDALAANADEEEGDDGGFS